MAVPVEPGTVRYRPPAAPTRGVGTPTQPVTRNPSPSPLPTRSSGQAELYRQGYQPPRYIPPTTSESRYTTNPVSQQARTQTPTRTIQPGYTGAAGVGTGLAALGEPPQFSPYDYLFGDQGGGGGGGWGGGGGGGYTPAWQPGATELQAQWNQNMQLGGLPLNQYSDYGRGLGQANLAQALYQNQIAPQQWALQQQQAQFGMGLQGREMTLNEMLGQSLATQRTQEADLANRQYMLSQQGQQFQQGMQTQQFNLQDAMQRGQLELGQAAQQLNRLVQTGQLDIAQANQALNDLKNRQQFGLQRQQQQEVERRNLVSEGFQNRGLNISERSLLEQEAARLAANRLTEQGQFLGAFNRKIGANLGAV